MPKVVIDNREIEVEDGATVLEAAKRLGISIPTLCDHPAVAPYGACRLCMVEVSSGGRPRLAAACTYPARDGMTVATGSEKALKARRFILELLLARSPDSEEIRELARRHGVEAGRFPSAAEPDKCVLCGLCVRVCRELIGKAAIGFIHRGMKRAVDTPFRSASEACIGCGACAFVCPTGAVEIDERDGNLLLKTWHGEVGRAKCVECGEFFATAEALNRIRESLGIPAEILERCSRCRRKKLGKELAGAPNP